MTYPCYKCGKPMKHLCADVFTCEDCLIIISEGPLLDRLQSSEQSIKEAEG